MSDQPQYKYVYGRGRSAMDLPESDIRYAISNTQSNAEAARFMKVSFTTWKKYASMYTDRETGKTLYDMHTNQAGVGIPKDTSRADGSPYSIDLILQGQYPKYPGYSERRVTDDTVPLLLDHMDGDITNHRIENIQMLCLNCYYQQVGAPFKADKEAFWNYNNLSD